MAKQKAEIITYLCCLLDALDMRQRWCVRAWAKGQTALALFITGSKTVPGVRPRLLLVTVLRKLRSRAT